MSVSSPESNGKDCKLHKETESFFSALKENGTASFTKQTVEQMRITSERIVEQFGGDVFFDGKIKQFSVPSLTGAIPVTAYIPKERGPKPSVFVYFHGEGFVSLPQKAGDSVCKILARESPCIVIKVEYRLAPECKFPACYEDAVSAVRWVTMNKGLLGASNESTVGVGGFSTGANIAASVCYELTGLSYQVLACPKLQMQNDSKSYLEFVEDPLINAEYLDRVGELFVNNEEDLKNIRCNPLCRENVDKLPPTLIVAAECDPVKDDAHAYSKKLKSAKVRTTLINVKGACHSFFTFPGHFKDCSEKAHLRVVDFIRSHSGHTNLLLLS